MWVRSCGMCYRALVAGRKRKYCQVWVPPSGISGQAVFGHRRRPRGPCPCCVQIDQFNSKPCRCCSVHVTAIQDWRHGCYAPGPGATR